MIRSFMGVCAKRIVLAVLCGGLALTTGTAKTGIARTFHSAGGLSNVSDDVPDHEDALNARARGEIKSLEEILQILKVRASDRLVDVVINRQDGRWIYGVTWLTKLGRYRIFSVDAKDGVVLKDETK